MDKLLKNILAIVGCLAALAAIALVVKKFLCKKGCKFGCCDEETNDVEDFVEEATEKVENAVEEAKESAEDTAEEVKEKAEAVAEEFKDYADVELPKED